MVYSRGIDDFLSRNSANAADAPSVCSAVNLKILLADDNSAFAGAVKRFLSNISGVAVVGLARDGLEALAMARDLEPDLLLLDIAMPKANGLEVARQLQRWAKPPLIVFLSMNDNESYRDKAHALGAVAFVSKSDFVDKLLPIVTSLVAVDGS
jgi:DNA-binding NarL/FixJ family response regulator